MSRLLILIAVGLSLACANRAFAGQAHRQMKYQKGTTCQAKLEAKGLKGAQYKAEMQKCTVNPDSYK
jgi:hypothetical protein